MKNIQVLGPGCPKCEEMYQNVERCAKELDIEFQIEKVSDIQKITEFGVMMTPALVIDGDVKIVGKVPSDDELKKVLGNL